MHKMRPRVGSKATGPRPQRELHTVGTERSTRGANFVPRTSTTNSASGSWGPSSACTSILFSSHPKVRSVFLGYSLGLQLLPLLPHFPPPNTFPVILPAQLELSWGGGASFCLPPFLQRLFLECKLFHVEETNLLILTPPPNHHGRYSLPQRTPTYPTHSLPRLDPGAVPSVFTWDCHGAGKRGRRSRRLSRVRSPPACREDHKRRGWPLPPTSAAGLPCQPGKASGGSGTK